MAKQAGTEKFFPAWAQGLIVFLMQSGEDDMLKRLIKSVPYISRLHGEIDQLKNELKRWRTWQPPGHFYSPIPDIREIQEDAPRIFATNQDSLPGIELNVSRQLELLREFGAYHCDLPVEWTKKGLSRYQFDNEYYSWADGIVLYSFLRHLRPKRVMEIGSGYSSALLLDVNDMFLDSAVEFTFIDPYPQRLERLLAARDSNHVRLLKKRVQDVDLNEFSHLLPGDFLLIDSSHVSKTGSDLNRILFEIIPRLNKGVWIHFHDIFYPFEYPREWVELGISWNEAYLLHAFLLFNPLFGIQFFTSYLLKAHHAAVEKSLPFALNSERTQLKITDAPGSSLWLRAMG